MTRFSTTDATTTPRRRDVESGPQPLNDIERRILDFMVAYLRTNTYQPSIREIGEQFAIKSTKTVSEHLQSLANKGYLERDPSRSRGVRILGVDLDPKAVSVPCFEEVPGERADLRADRADAHLSLDRRLVGSKGAFMLTARPGDLEVIGVSAGDLVLVEPVAVDEVEDGEIVAARAGTGTCFHRFERNGTGLRLASLQAGAEPTYVEQPADLFLMGRVTGFYRRMADGAAGLNLTPH